MKRLLAINESNYGSTGIIMRDVADISELEYIIAVSNSRSNRKNISPNTVLIGNSIFRNLHLLFSKFTGLNGVGSIVDTLWFLRRIKKFKPDIIHIHNLHNCYINIPLLFHYIKREKIPVVWTLHDCWAFTGRCPHFILAACDKWKTGCCHCKYPTGDYPQSKIDNTKCMWKLKKKWFTGVENMTIVTPSQWLADLVKQSFLREYPVKVINNGINLSVFHPTPSTFRKKYGIPAEKSILLGVAFGWGRRKGLDVFIELSKRLAPEKYQIILVGTNDNVDKKLPDNIISIHRTLNQQELAEIYTAADLFVNLTREDTFPTVNMEALACGTPVLTFMTGGSPEIIDETCGAAVMTDDIETLCSKIESIVSDKSIRCSDCLRRSQKYDEKQKFLEYKELFSLLGDK